MKSYDLPKPRLCKSIIEYKVTSYVLRVVVPILVSISFSRNNKNVFRNNRFQQMSTTYSYVDHGTRMTLSSMFCVLQASCGVCMVVQSFWTTRDTSNP